MEGTFYQAQVLDKQLKKRSRRSYYERLIKLTNYFLYRNMVVNAWLIVCTYSISPLELHIGLISKKDKLV